MKQKLMVFFAAIFMAITTASFAEVPRLINYQGRLTDAEGVPVNGTKQVTFSIYDTETGGIPLWTEDHTVVAQNGVFSVLLGSMPASPLNIDFDKQYYIEIKVDNTVLNPRMKMASSAYAISAANGVPNGVILMWSGAIDQIPVGWALCDGTNATPDLRNRFIVGAGDTYVVANTGGSAQHTLTVGEMPSHTHSLHSPTTRSAPSGGGAPQYWANTTTKNTNATGGNQPHENRPPYYALAYIMKV